jgi:hypothetical protein
LSVIFENARVLKVSARLASFQPCLNQRGAVCPDLGDFFYETMEE